MSISRDEVLMGRDKQYPLTQEMEDNLKILLERLNQFRQAYGKAMLVSSGYRPGPYNKAAGGAKKSAHLSCKACDFKDSDGALKKFVKDNPDILEKCDLYQEHPDHTSTWLHLDIVPRANRVFKP